MNKRDFIKSTALTAIGTTFGMDAISAMFKSKNGISPVVLAQDEKFWSTIRKQYLLKPDYINLENGYYNFIPQPLVEKFISHFRHINYHGSWYMRNFSVSDKAKVVEKLAAVVGCSAEELAITRNATESLDIVIAGKNWQAGDETIMAEQDYGTIVSAMKHIASRFGVVNKMVSVPNLPSSDEEIVSLYENAITPKTKFILVSHIINITGQILPIRKICDMAHAHGVEVCVDGAHAIAHFKFNISDLNCDYYGSSLHKWLSTPLGAGLLYVKKEKIPGVWPLIIGGEKDPFKMQRISHMGTHPAHTTLTISDAIDYYNTIGAERKEARLRYLQVYWTSRVRKLPRIILNTPEDPNRACGIANVGIEGIQPKDLAKRLMDEYKIFTVGIDSANVYGCRITPNVYTTTDELDIFINALKKMSA
ncbi:MAG: aminotransferase class V-fold PLP-dependent enzyme [bacterium]|jgi:selenocysteine lyase/cysteine desulfurase|nr:aminotransferase class V-fold PLP-dependent enzyme [Chitinophagaceae bacterium]